jgi:secreted trypsin-like serine protease
VVEARKGNALRLILILFINALLAASCGKSQVLEEVQTQDVAIVGGDLVQENEFSGVVAIIRARDVICSGVAIDRHYILTAAHCLLGNSSSSLSVYTGKGYKLPGTNRRNIRGQYKVVRTHVYPTVQFRSGVNNFNFGNFDVNDVGLIELDRPLERTIKAYSIAKSVDVIYKFLVPGNKVTVVGYGYTGEDFGFGPEVTYGLKRKVEVPLVNYNHHEADIREVGKDSCYVDSGGPAFIEVDGEYKIMATVSRADGLCGEAEFPVHYSLTYDSLCWINSKISRIEPGLMCARQERIANQCFHLPDDEVIECAKKQSDLFFEHIH